MFSLTELLVTGKQISQLLSTHIYLLPVQLTALPNPELKKAAKIDVPRHGNYMHRSCEKTILGALSLEF